MKRTFILLLLCFSNYLFAQKHGIHNTDPKTALDISGAVIVRPIFFNITSTASIVPNNLGAIIVQNLVTSPPTFSFTIPSVYAGQKFLIENPGTYTSLLGGTAIVPTGVSEFIYSNSSWKLLSTNNTEPFKWSLLGNANTNPLTDYVGTKDAEALPFYFSNTEKMRLAQNGLQIKNAGFVELGNGYIKEVSAGKMGYALFTPQTLDIVGAGTLFDDRKIKFWAEEMSTFEGEAFFKKAIGISTTPVDGKLQINSSTAVLPTIALKDSLTNSAGHISFRTVGNNLQGMNIRVNSTGAAGNLNNMSIYSATNMSLPTHIFHGNGHTEIKGKIDIADDNITPVAGTIRFNTTTMDYEGFNGTIWKSFTVK